MKTQQLSMPVLALSAIVDEILNGKLEGSWDSKGRNPLKWSVDPEATPGGRITFTY